MKVEVIVAAAGEGLRLGGSVPKPLVPLAGKPLFAHCVEVFERCNRIDGLIIVTADLLLDRIQAEVSSRDFKKVKSIVVGGATRSLSVACGLDALDADTEFVLIHDAARPFVTEKLVDRCLDGLQHSKAVVVSVGVKPTVKEIDSAGRVVHTLDRNRIVEAQTPQGFHRRDLFQAHAQSESESATDDAALVERLGVSVQTVEGDYRNIKITTAEDLSIAEHWMSD